MYSDTKKIVLACRQIFEEGAPGPEHQRLVSVLDIWAKNLNYTSSHSGFKSGEKPDVLRVSADNKYLFVGDAKDAANEDSQNRETLKRIEKYVHKFSEALKDGCEGGNIAIATNTIDAANGWISALNYMCRKEGITANGEMSSFRVKKENENTYIIYW